MRICVTGGTGFLGRHVVERLKRNHELVVLARRPQPIEGVSVAKGDVTDRATLPSAMDGCEALIHLAGFVSQHPDDAERLYDVHVRGTENALEEARRAGIKRVVYLSTSGTVAVSKEEEFITNESSETPKEIIYRWPYYRSKLIGEETALAKSDAGFGVISLNPSLLLGPGDTDGESTRSIRMFLDGQLPVAPPGGLSFVDARDVATAVETALWRGRPGSRYLLGAVNMTFMAYYERLARLTTLKPPAMKAPPIMRTALDWLPGWGKNGFGFGFTVDRVSMEQACHTWYLDDTRARAELGWSPRDPIETLRDTLADMLDRSKGYNAASHLRG